jgi:acetolactate synthase small subunit
LLLVNEDERLEQLSRQLGKLEDVVAVRRAPHAGAAFAAVASHLRSSTAS